MLLGNLRSISLELTRRSEKLCINLVPGQKLCSKCQARISSLIKEKNDQIEENYEGEAMPSDEDVSEIEKSFAREQDRSQLKECFSAMCMSPIKSGSLPSSSKVSVGKRKLEAAVSSMKTKIARSLDIPPEKIEISKSTMDKEVMEKADAFDYLMKLLADKTNSVETSRAKIQILTLSPPNWSIKATAQYFNVSEYLVRTARKLAAEKGILTFPDPKKGHGLSNTTVGLIHQFYHDDEFTRLMPGQKDFVSIGKNVHKQKRLLMCILKELFVAFKEKFPIAKVSFAKFCSLRPKWCVLLGASGTHSVCVCTMHQNTKLLLAPIGENYKELMKLLVCSIENRECMIKRCPDCPKTSDALLNHLNMRLSDFEDDYIQFSQWTTTDRSILVQQQETVSEYIRLVVDQMNKLTAHSYIAKAQSQYLKKRKEELDEKSALILGDFAENYKFVIQDEVQSFHWNNLQCTLHPVVVYYQNCNMLKHFSYCIISNDLEHDTGFVYEVQKKVLADIKLKLSGLENIEYFSDGCAAQYKNRKNFMNLCMHEQDFGVKASWTFFATSHGKQPCDGIGGTVKRLVSKASLQRSLKDQILDPKAMFHFCRKNVNEIIFFFIDKDDLAFTREMLESRFKSTVAVPGTRLFHQYDVLDESTVLVKRCSEDLEYSLKHNLLGIQQKYTSICIESSDYVACVYESKWWVGLVIEVDRENQDVLTKFMEPHGPSRSFHWPEHRDDICWVPMAHVLAKVEVPTTASGRQYHLSSKDHMIVERKFAEQIKH